MKLRSIFAGTVLASGLVSATGVLAQDTIKVGVLHSLSGTMAISETTLKDTMLMLVEQQNAKGCLLYTSPSPRDRQKSRMPSSA